MILSAFHSRLYFSSIKKLLVTAKAELLIGFDKSPAELKGVEVCAAEIGIEHVVDEYFNGTALESITRSPVSELLR